MSGCIHYMLKAQHMLNHWAISYMLSRGRLPVEGSAHAGHMLCARRTLSCSHQRSMLAVPYPATPPHTTQSGTDYTDKLFTSYHNLGPSLPWEGSGPGGWAQHAPPLLWGLISPPARLGPGATASGLWGRR